MNVFANNFEYEREVWLRFFAISMRRSKVGELTQLHQLFWMSASGVSASLK